MCAYTYPGWGGSLYKVYPYNDDWYMPPFANKELVEWNDNWLKQKRGREFFEVKGATLTTKVPFFVYYRIRDLSKYNKLTKGEVIRFLIDKGLKSLGIDLNQDPFVVKIEIPPAKQFLCGARLYDWQDIWIKAYKKWRYGPFWGGRSLSVCVPWFIYKRVRDLCEYNRLTKSEVFRFLIDRGLRSLGVDLNKEPFEVKIDLN